MAKGIYLDNSMAARPSDKTVSRMLPYFNQFWGSPSSPHLMGQEAASSVRDNLRALYSLLGAKDSDSIVLTSSGAEAVNQAVMSTYHEITRTTGKNHFVTSNIDEAPSIVTIGRLELYGCVGKMVHADKHGRVTAEIIADAITPRTAMVSLSWANGLTGVINPVAEIGKLCQERGILLHLDATHILGRLYFELDDIGASFISFNGDQLHGPKGTGCLYVKNGVKCSPFILGGIEQAGLRAGTVNIPGLAGLASAANETMEARDYVCTEIARLRNKLETGILDTIPNAVAFFKEEERLPHCTAIGFAGIPNEALLYALNKKGVFASIGGGSFQQIGLILSGSGIDDLQAGTAIGFSLSRDTTDEEIEKAIEIIGECAKNLRKVSEKFMEEKYGV